MGNFATIVGSGALASVLAPNVPQWVAITGACVLAVFGAATLAIRPADKAAANETDLRRYSRLLTEASRMEADELTEALAKAKEGNAPEIEPLRRVVYNDVVREIGRDDEAFELSFHVFNIAVGPGGRRSFVLNCSVLRR